jgi:hypothetical protein
MPEYIQGWLIEGGIDNTLPPRPPLPSRPPYIDNSLPPPPGLWPPPTEIWPPIALPPGYPMPPGSIWPPTHPPDPGYGQGHPAPPVAGMPLPGAPGHPANPPPLGPGHPDAGLPVGPGHPGNALPSVKYLVAIVGGSASSGWKVIGYTVVDPSLTVGMPLPGNQPGIDNTLPGRQPGVDNTLPNAPARPGGGPAPTPEPKR